MVAPPDAVKADGSRDPDGGAPATYSPDAEHITRLNLEIMALQRENADLRRAEETLKKACIELNDRVRERTVESESAHSRVQIEIEERRRAETALHESEERYRSIVEQSPDAIVVHDAEGRLLYANPVALRLTGVQSIQDLGGRSVFTTLPEEGLDHIRDGIWRLLQGEPVPPIWMPMQLPNGSQIDVEVTAARVIFDGYPAIQVVLRDITERKRAERAIEEREEQLRTLIENSADGILITDEAGRIVTWSRGMETIAGLAAGDVLGMPAWEVQSLIVNKEWAGPDHRTRYRALLDRILRDNTYPHHNRLLDVQIRTPQGEVRHLQQRVFTTSTRLGFRVGVILRDITERKRAEEALEHHAKDLARLNRELKSAHREANLYLDILTHDIRNTENVSNLYTELLVDTLDGEAAGHMEKLRRSINKSIEILGTVSKIRRIHHGLPDIRPVDLDAVIRNETGRFPDNIIRYTGLPVLVRADDLLPEVLANLIGNAVKHGGPDVAVTIRTEDLNGEVRVSVEDTGPGVPDEQKEAIFHRYEQKKRGVGEGLGLYLVQILIERYDGKVRVEDRVPGHHEEGAAFRFTLKKA